MLHEVLTRRLPRRIDRLDELAHNLYWSWNHVARDVFRMLDYALWKTSGHNPVQVLQEVSPERLQQAANDPEYLLTYDQVMKNFDTYLTEERWFNKNYPAVAGPVAYFSSEFAIHHSLPIYAGGLGVLAGDICKEASDLGLPLVGIGLMYPKGYFNQRISSDGWQQEEYRQVDFNQTPICPVFGANGSRVLAKVQLGDRLVSLGVWQVRVGRTNIYLLHTDLEDNHPDDRQLCDRLYIANQDIRIQQEIVLGIGGVRVLRALGITPAIWHANEGHSAFMMLERIRELVVEGASFSKAMDEIRTTTVFTTHTPVPAGHDIFPDSMVEWYFHDFWKTLNIDKETFLKLGGDNGSFNMTHLALTTGGRYNAVSKLNGVMSRRMWHNLWPELPEDEVPITHITNGIHVPTWISPEMARLFSKHLGKDWMERHDDTRIWDRIIDIPDEELWAVRCALKRKLTRDICRRAQGAWANDKSDPRQILASGALLDTEALTIGFVRRFADYKRPSLIFRDLERLKRIVKDVSCPVQIVFAGKAHPNDFPAKVILQQTYAAAKDNDLCGRIAFIEDYDMHMAHYLVPGVDVWLNNPRRCREACGTSGIKASLNGVPHLSVLDGWWCEGFNGANGFVIGNGHEAVDTTDEDNTDSNALYTMLEEKIIPLYYDRDANNIPHGWVALIKEAIRSVVPAFSARRMMKDYTEQMYHLEQSLLK